jgi:hypothetical protein
MGSHNGSIDTTHNPPPLSFYNTFKVIARKLITILGTSTVGAKLASCCINSKYHLR